MHTVKNLFDESFAAEMDRGKIKVNEFYQTSVPNIYAAGDVIGGIQLAHTATAEAINAVCHMLGKEMIYETSLILAVYILIQKLHLLV